MRFAIMQGTPGYRRDETSAEEPITGQEGTLLRLLLLRRGHPLSTEEIARHLTPLGKAHGLAVVGARLRRPPAQQDRPGPHTEHGGLLLNRR